MSRLDPTRTSLSGYGGTLEAGKQGGGHWMYIAGVNLALARPRAQRHGLPGGQ